MNLCGLSEDGGGLDHLDHKGRAPAGQIIAGADPREDTIGKPHRETARRHKQSSLAKMTAKQACRR